MIKAIIFDIGDVVIDTTDVPGEYKKQFGLNGKRKWILDLSTSKKYTRGNVSQEYIYSYVSKKYKIPKKDVEKKLSACIGRIRSMKGMSVLLDRLKKKKGLKLAVLSNVSQHSMNHIRKQNHYRWFDPIILSCEVGHKKPGKRIFYITLEKLKLKPEECIFVDDLKENIDTAKKIGFKTVLFKNAASLKENLRKKGISI